MRGTLMPSTAALSVFCATACMARPVTVRLRNVWVNNTKHRANTKVPMSEPDTLTPATFNTTSGNTWGKGCGSELYPARTPLRMAIDKPMVATTMGIMPCLNKGSTSPRLNNQPNSSTATPHDNKKAKVRGRPWCSMMTITNAGSMTNSPWAKLMVPEACHSKVKPKAAKA